MLLEGTEIAIKRSDDLVERNFGIRAEDTPHIFSILRSKLYSNKIAAPIREYSTNATDAHAECGKPDLPIQVTLPTSFDPVFKVRDFGEGLSREGIFEIYVSYGRSTKRGDNVAIGQLGLGSKSAYAYGNNFVITSWHKGKKSIYNAYIDESSVGKVALMSETESNEPSGIEIQIPVRREDINTFCYEAANIYGFFRVKPIIKGVTNFIPWSPKVTFEGKGWKFFTPERRETSFAVMGDIGYPLSYEAIRDMPQDLVDLINSNIIIDFNIGDLNISASREALEYTEHSIRNIKKKLREVQSVLLEKITKDIESCATEFEARKKLGTMIGANNGFARLASNMLRNRKVKWHDKNVSGTAVQSKDLTAAEIIKLPANKYGKARYDKNWWQIEYDEKVYFAVKDIDDSWVIRAESYYNQLKTKVLYPMLYVIVDIEAGKEDEILNKLGLTKPEIKPLSEIELTPDEVEAKKVKVINRKHSLPCFTLDWNASTSPRSTCWQPCDLDLDEDKGIFVELDKFFVVFNGKEVEVANIKALEYMLNPAEFSLKTNPLYGIKTKLIEKVGANLIRLEKFVTDNFNRYLEEQDMGRKIVDYEAVSAELSIDVDKIMGAADRFINNCSPLLRYAEAIYEMRKHYRIFADSKQMIELCKELGIGKEKKPTYDLEAMRNQIFQRYPLLKTLRLFIKTYNPTTYDQVDIEAIVQYINSIDSQETKK